MRVIAGATKGRRLRTVAGMAVRPTADKVKGALFNILQSRFTLESTHLLDLFAGSGTLGIEALSRGAAHVTFVEQAAPAAAVLRDNLSRCGLTDRAEVLQMPVERALPHLIRRHVSVDGIILDPPYGHGWVGQTLTDLAARGILRPGAWVIVEHHIDEAPASAYGRLRLTQARRYGKTALALLVDETMAESRIIENSMRRAVYAGSFDPITNGHLDVVRRAIAVFDHVIVAVAAVTSDAKKDPGSFTAQERIQMIRGSLADAGDRISVDHFSGLLVDYCDQVGASVIIRGLRAVSDFEYEFQMAMMNRHLKPHIQTMFMATGETHSYTSSRLVKEVAALGGDVHGLVPEVVHKQLLKKLRHPH